MRVDHETDGLVRELAHGGDDLVCQRGKLRLMYEIAKQVPLRFGGIGMTMFGGSSNVSIDSPSFMPQLNMWSDGVIPHLTQFSDRIHAQRSTLMCQLTHLGRRGEFDKGFLK